MKRIFSGTGGPARPSELTQELQARIRASFDDSSNDEEHFPSTIDPRIYHVRLIAEFLAPIAPDRVLDAGCGKGRFARVLRESQPNARFCGMDISTAMLAYVPPEIERCAGSLTALPFASCCFDAAYATESLEHAVDIQTAVAELCRVVKPGGGIAIIDKNAEHWGQLETPEWERWFTRQEMTGLLKRHCRDVSSRLISYWEDVEPDGLFLAWLATK